MARNFFRWAQTPSTGLRSGAGDLEDRVHSHPLAPAARPDSHDGSVTAPNGFEETSGELLVTPLVHGAEASDRIRGGASHIHSLMAATSTFAK